MIKMQFITRTLRIFISVSAFLPLIGNAAAVTVDPFVFCANSCKPGPCDKAEVKADCQKLCKDSSIWKHVASLQMSGSSKEFRTEKDQSAKGKMLYKSPIAQCLGLVAKEPEKAEARPLEPAPLPPAPTRAPMMSTPKISDLCAAAIRKEMGALKGDMGALETQNKDLQEALRALETAPAR